MADAMSDGTNFDGSPRFMSFYVNTNTGWTGTAAVRDAAVHAYNLGHSIGNHTHNHPRFVGGTSWSALPTGNHPNNHTRRMSLRNVYNNMAQARDAMIAAGIPAEHQFGFRTPFLAYSDTAFLAMRRVGMLYDCSIEGIVGTPGTTNFPYTLDIIPGVQEADQHGNVPPDNRGNWGRPQIIDGQRVQNIVREHPGLWLLPASLVEIDPADRPYIERPSGMNTWIVTGFDWNLWAPVAEWGLALDSAQTVNALMYTLKKHLEGNRAPFTFGPHSQFFWGVGANFPQITNAQRQGAFEEFLRKASELEDVFFVAGDMVIAWMQNPVSASEFNPEDFHRDGQFGATVPEPDLNIDPDYIDNNPLSIMPNRTNHRTTAGNMRIGSIRAGNLNLSVATAGIYTVSIHSVDGKMLAQTQTNLVAGLNTVNFSQDLARGVAIVRVANANTVSQRRISIR
jgi:hypothetical protein